MRKQRTFSFPCLRFVFIEGGSVFVDGVQVFKTDKKLTTGEKIVLRGKGKVLLLEQKGESKKGRLRVIIRRYL